MAFKVIKRFPAFLAAIQGFTCSGAKLADHFGILTATKGAGYIPEGLK